VGDCAGNGLCTPKPDACTDLFDPVCGCDGQTYANACTAAQAGVSVARKGVCQEVCLSDRDCTAPDFCRRPDGGCDGPGVCATPPDGCPDVYDPVCGCDGTTYGNACVAAARRVSIAYRGACKQECIHDCECGPGQYCEQRPGSCGGGGVCADKPNGCAQIWAPVCGCDATTYPNACEAAAQGVSVDYRGECDADHDCYPDALEKRFGSDPNVPDTVVGDVDCSGTVSITDLIKVRGAFGRKCTEVGWNPRLDINNSCTISITDLILVRGHFGSHLGP